MESLGKYLNGPALPAVNKPRAKRPYPGIFQAIGLVVYLAVVELFVYGFAGAFAANANLDSPRFAICSLISTAIILRYGLWKAKASFSQVFPLARVRLSLFPAIAFCLIGLSVITFNVEHFIYLVHPPPVFIRHLFPDLLQAGGYWNAFFQLVLVAPLAEELLVRGLILRGLLKRYGPVKAVVASAVLFGAVHGNVYQFSSAVVAGLLLGWWAIETKSLLPCLFGHAFWNLFVFTLFMVPRWWPSANLSVTLKSAMFVPSWVVLAGACVFGVGLFMFSRNFQGKHSFEHTAAAGLSCS